VHNRTEVHICLAPNGHLKSQDCWCEPVEIRWYTVDGTPVLVTVHEDYTLQHHLAVLEARREGLLEDNWITRVLDGAVDYPLAAHRDIKARSDYPNERGL
jgi:hypothetical protein